MRTARQRDEHRAALDRRFAQLQAELHGLPAAPQQSPDPNPDPGPSGTRLRVVQPLAPDHLAPDHAPRTEPTGSTTEPTTGSATQPTGAPLLPTPGRHAARRPRPVPRDWAQRASAPLAPATARWTVAPAHLRVVAVVVVLALLGTGWWLVRSRPESLPSEVGLTVAPPGATPAPAGGLPTPPAPAADPAAGSEPASEPPTESGQDPAADAQVVIVHVAGRVRRPGIVRLPVGARVSDALEAAGGSRPGVRLADVNLARTLVDGEQVLVGLPGAVPASGVPGAVSGSGAASTTGQPTLVDLNTADQVLLETLPGVGPVTAGKILAWREQHDRFSAVEELLEIDGIGDATLADLAPLVTV